MRKLCKVVLNLKLLFRLFVRDLNDTIEDGRLEILNFFDVLFLKNQIQFSQSSSEE